MPYPGGVIDLSKHEFSISVTAAVFFDQTAKWLRKKDTNGQLVDGAGPIGSRSEYGDRKYTLGDVKRMAVALHRRGIIDADGLRACLIRIEGMYTPVYRRRKQR